MSFSYDTCIFVGVIIEQELVTVETPSYCQRYSGMINEHSTTDIAGKPTPYCTDCGRKTDPDTRREYTKTFKKLFAAEYMELPNRHGETHGGAVYNGYDVFDENDVICIGDMLLTHDPTCDSEVHELDVKHIQALLTELPSLVMLLDKDNIKVKQQGLFVFSQYS